ncbi:MAG: HNH endonuclease [Alistipes sp.]|nr:HNH endonuclease [Alistipes sp.]
MKFFMVKKGRASDEDLLDDMRTAIRKLDSQTLTIKEYDTYGNYSSSTVIRRFGSWKAALNLISISPGNVFYTVNDLLDNIRDAWLIKGSQPTRRDMDNHFISKISSGTYLRHFGNWYNALDAFVQYMQDRTLDDKVLMPHNQDSIIHKTKREPSARLKVQVLMRDGNKCRLCGVECNDGLHNIHFDHIVPWAKGGETVLENLQVLCSDCNLAKGNVE